MDIAPTDRAGEPGAAQGEAAPLLQRLLLLLPPRELLPPPPTTLPASLSMLRPPSSSVSRRRWWREEEEEGEYPAPSCPRSMEGEERERASASPLLTIPPSSARLLGALTVLLLDVVGVAACGGGGAYALLAGLSSNSAQAST